MKRRVYYYDRLRIIATIAVVLIHVCAPELFRFSIASPCWDVCNVGDSLSRFAVPIFIMLSGAIFLDRENKIEIRSLYSRNLLRIIGAFFAWSAFYAVCHYNGSVSDLFKNFFLGHFHMYFLFLIGALYLAVPVYRKICEDEKIMKYFLALCIVFTFFLPSLSKFPHMSVVSDMLAKAKFNFVAGYSAYFVGGYYLSQFEFSKGKRAAIYIAGCFGFVATVLLTRNASLRVGAFVESFYSYFSVNILLQSVAVFVFGRYNLNFEPKSKITATALTMLSKLTFGVYLSHVFVLDCIRNSSAVIAVSSVGLYMLLELILTLLISGVISFVLNKIPFIKKYIV